MATTRKTFNDLEKLANLRTKVVEEVLLVLADDPKINEWSDFKKRLVEKMSTNILPRLNEHTGEGGEPIQFTGVDIVLRQ